MFLLESAINRCDFLFLINCRLIDQFTGDRNCLTFKRMLITMCRCEKQNSNKESRCIQGYGAVCWIKPQVIFIMTFTGILNPIGDHSLLLHLKMTINPSNLCISTQPKVWPRFLQFKRNPNFGNNLHTQMSIIWITSEWLGSFLFRNQNDKSLSAPVSSQASGVAETFSHQNGCDKMCRLYCNAQFCYGKCTYKMVQALPYLLPFMLIKTPFIVWKVMQLTACAWKAIYSPKF
jgi:hypothetical protein